MQNRTAHFTETVSDLSVGEVVKVTRNWLLDGELSNRSPKTVKARRDTLDKLSWFLTHRKADVCGVEELRAFFLYLQKGHCEPGGRWGNPTQTKPLRPLTFKTYYAYLRAFFNFAVQEGHITTSPMGRIPSPRDPGDEVMPFTDVEVDALLKAAEGTQQAARNVAILYLLIDTGIRAQEMCSLQYTDVDFSQRSLSIHEGKGRKTRLVFIGKKATRVLWKYVQQDGREEDDPLFFSERGDGLTYWGLALLFRRLGKAANVKKCHPHRCRHLFAISFLREGGNQFSLMRLLGHTTLTVTNRYVQMAQADVQAQHRACSPGDRISRRKK